MTVARRPCRAARGIATPAGRFPAGRGADRTAPRLRRLRRACAPTCTARGRCASPTERRGCVAVSRRALGPSQRLRLRCLRAAFAFARRLRSAASECRGVLPSTSSPSVAGATRRASRTITNAIPISSSAPITTAGRTTLLNLPESEDVLVVAVVVSSEDPSVSSLNAPPAPRPAASAAGAGVPASASRAARDSTHALARRLRDVGRERLGTWRA